MIARMFWRRGSWGKQLGIDGHMGYGGFHLTQFFHFGKTIDTDRENSLFQTWGSVRGTLYLLVYLVPTLLMLFGWYYLYKRRRNEALLLILLVLLTTIGLVLYMNFADGHHAEKRDYQMWLRSGRQGPMPTVYREVRVRDYFFTPGFMFFGMWIGVASGCLLHFLYTSTRRLLRTHIAPVASVFFALSPLLPIAQNFAGNDRSRDWVPYDYAYNLLMSCKRDAILITNGDNDTFPLWFLQEAEGIRRDVRVVNLSLLNTTWYIKQLKELQPRVPISFSDARIDALNAELNPLAEPTVYKQAGAGITIQIPGRNQMHVLRVQDKALLNIVDTNRWRKPIYFAATVSNDNMLGLQPYLQMQGLGYEILPQRVPAEQRLDVERTVFLLDKVYRFTGLGQTKRPLNETTIQMLSNYAACFLQVVIQMRDSLANLADTTAALEQALAAGPGSDSAETLRDARAAAQTRYREKLDFVVTKLNQCVDIMPWDWRPRALRHEMLLAHGRTEEALEKLREARRIEPGNIQYMKMEVQTLDKLGRHTDAAEVLKDLARSDLDSWEVHALLCTRYEELGLWDSAIWVMQQFQRRHPGDRRAEAMMARLTAVGGAALQRRSESTTRMD
jgi:tetratricopeptide (TPR) repeat protein